MNIGEEWAGTSRADEVDEAVSPVKVGDCKVLHSQLGVTLSTIQPTTSAGHTPPYTHALSLFRPLPDYDDI